MPEQLERYEQKPLSEQTKQNLMDQLTLADHLVYKKYLPDLQNYALVDPTEQMVGGKITDDYMKVFKLEELTVKQGEDQLQKLSTVYHSSMALGCSLAVLVSVKKSGAPASIYLGVRRNLRQKNSEAIENLDISFKTLHEGMKSNFPGSQTSRIYASDDQQDTESLNYLLDGAFGDKMRTITSASCVAALRDKSKTENKAFIQGIERFMDAMGDHVYTALFLADPVSENDQASIRSSYAAMPAILKDAVERCYRNTGWDLRRSVNVQMTYPTFYDLMDILPSVIQESEYSKDTQSDYTGALYTRVRSLTTGIYGNILCAEDGLEDAELFDCNVIVDLSRVTSMETKSLLMGLLVIKLQEYRMCTSEMNQPLRHITVLEEAHNLLRRTSDVQAQESANLQGKSVEMLTDAIAEMRTYGEGFVIADQSPGLLDPAVIRNTNTKMILRLPSEEDRKLVGKSAGLNDKQIEELAKLEMGVAAVYQNEWNEPILCKVNYYPEPENCYQKPCSMEMDSDTELVMRELLSEKEESELPKEVLEHWWKHWQNRIDTTTGQYLCEVLENQNDKCDEVIQKAVYDIFEGKQLFGWYGNKMESRTDAYGELIERLCGRYRLSEKIAKEILDCIMTTGLEEAKNKEGVEAIRKKYNEQRSEQV